MVERRVGDDGVELLVGKRQRAHVGDEPLEPGVVLLRDVDDRRRGVDPEDAPGELGQHWVEAEPGRLVEQVGLEDGAEPRRQPAPEQSRVHGVAVAAPEQLRVVSSRRPVTSSQTRRPSIQHRPQETVAANRTFTDRVFFPFSGGIGSSR